MNLNIKFIFIISVDENVGRALYDIQSRDFLKDKTSLTKQVGTKINKWDYVMKFLIVKGIDDQNIMSQ